MVALASVIAIIGGTSAFFLLRGCGVEATATCTRYPSQIYALIPAPTLAISALLVQQAVVATFRGRLMLAIETELMAGLQEEYRLGDGSAPIFATYRFQQPMNHERRGMLLWTIMFVLPFLLVIGLIYYSGLLIPGFEQWLFYGFYVVVILVIAWAGLPVLRGYKSLDNWLAGYIAGRRS